jgi:Tol biopolymer transport system component
MWFDRQGNSLAMEGAPTVNPEGLAFSPDRARVAVSTSSDIWLLDLARNTNTRFTFGQGSNTTPVWSPDGSRIAFASNRNGAYDLHQKLTSGVKDEELLLKSGDNKLPTSWSRDGRFLLYTATDVKTKEDLWVLPLEGDRKPVLFLNKEFNESDGHFSPDMRWVAYVSDESGSNEIYVRGFSQASGASPETGGKRQVSVGGGMGPRWGRDGKELYYRALDGKVMVVEVTAGAAFQIGRSKALFQAPPDFLSGPISFWDVTSDGNRFLLTAPATEASPTPFTVVLNWQAELKK